MATKTTKKFQLNFDKFQRYQMVEDVITSVRRKSRLTILDIGTPSNYLSQFLPNDRIVTIDFQRSKGKQFVQSDALHLPFSDASFDVAISLDVLEHIPPKRRPQFLDEQARVASEFMILGAPFQSADVELAERIAWEQIKQRYGIEHTFLTEHQQHGLPDLPRTLKHLERQGLTCMAFPNGYLPNWLLMLLVDFHAEWSKAPKPLQRRVLETYNKHYYPLDNREPSYRHIIVASRRPGLVQALPHHLSKTVPTGPPPAPLAPSIVKLFDATLATHVEQAIKAADTRFEEERRSWTADRQARQRQHEQELRKHQQLARRNLEQTSRDFVRQLHEAKREIERLNNEIHQLHRNYQSQLAQRQEQLDAQQTAHQQTLAALEQRLAAAHQQELARVREQAGQEQARVHTQLAQLQQELRQARETYQTQLALRDQQAADASSALHDVKADAAEAEQALHAALATARQQYQALLQQREALETAHHAAQARFAEQLEALQNELSALHGAYQTQLDALSRASAEASSRHTAEMQRAQVERRTELERLQQRLDDSERSAREEREQAESRRRALEERLQVLTTESDAIRRDYQQAMTSSAMADEALRAGHREALESLERRAAAERNALTHDARTLAEQLQQAERRAQEALLRQQESAQEELLRQRQAAQAEVDQLNQAIARLHAGYREALSDTSRKASDERERLLQENASLRREYEQTVQQLRAEMEAALRERRAELQELTERLEHTQTSTSEHLTQFFTERTAPLADSMEILHRHVQDLVTHHTERYERLVRHIQTQRKTVEEQRATLKDLQRRLNRLASVPLNRWLLKHAPKPRQDAP